MKKYSDYKNYKKDNEPLTREELSRVEWTKYKIIVPTQEDKDEIMEALEHFHNQGYDLDNVTNNQLAHEYLTGNNIVVSEDLYKLLEK